MVVLILFTARYVSPVSTWVLTPSSGLFESYVVTSVLYRGELNPVPPLDFYNRLVSFGGLIYFPCALLEQGML